MVRQNGTNTLSTGVFHVVVAHRVPQIIILNAKFLLSFSRKFPRGIQSIRINSSCFLLKFPMRNLVDVNVNFVYIGRHITSSITRLRVIEKYQG